MTRKVNRNAAPALAHQRGVVLAVSLALLLIITIVGLSAVRLITVQERMVNYTFDRATAFQASEAALRAIEDGIEAAGLPAPAAGAGCSLMGAPMSVQVCGAPSLGSMPRWLNPSFTDWVAAPNAGVATPLVTPQYFVEYLGNTFPCDETPGAAAECMRYRITVRANADPARASVMLQSVYAPGV